MHSSIATWHFHFHTPGNQGVLSNGRFAQQVTNALYLLGNFGTLQHVTVDRGERTACYTSDQASERPSPALMSYLRCHDDVDAVQVLLDLTVLEAVPGGYGEEVLPGAALLTIASLGEHTTREADGAIVLELFTDAHCERENAPMLKGFLKRLARRMGATLSWTRSDDYELDETGLMPALPLAVGQ